MKYILALFVLLAAYIMANIADDYEEIDPGYVEPTGKGERHGDWRYNQFCRQFQNASFKSYKSKSKEIQRSWERYSKDLKKNIKTFARKAVKKIIKTSTHPLKNITSLKKMSQEEFQTVQDIIESSTREMTQAVIEMQELFNLTYSLLKTGLAEAASQLGLSSKIYGDKIHELLKSFQFEILCISSVGDDESDWKKEKYQDLTEEAKREVVHLVRVSSKMLRDTFSFQAKHIKTIASRAGQIVVSVARKHTEKFYSKEYLTLNMSLKKVEAMAQLFKEKYKLVALTTLGSVDPIVNRTLKSMKTFIKETEVKVNNASPCMVKADAIEKMGNEVDKIYKPLQTITENNDVKGVSEMTADTIEKLKESISKEINSKTF